MKVLDKSLTEKTLTLEVDSNEETLFSMLRIYFQEMPEVDIAGFTKDHHLVDKTEFFLKVKSGNPEEVFKKGLESAKKHLGELRQN